MSYKGILENCIVMRAARMHRILTRQLDNDLRNADLGITSQQLLTLAYFAQYPKKRAVDMGSEYSIEKSVLSRNLRILVRDGLIEQSAQSGRRGRTLTVTDRGKDILNRGNAVWSQTQARLRTLAPQGIHELLETE
jgi:DNA-binding MarR family transcriptional regulator